MHHNNELRVVCITQVLRHLFLSNNEDAALLHAEAAAEGTGTLKAHNNCQVCIIIKLMREEFN